MLSAKVKVKSPLELKLENYVLSNDKIEKKTIRSSKSIKSSKPKVEVANLVK